MTWTDIDFLQGSADRVSVELMKLYRLDLADGHMDALDDIYELVSQVDNYKLDLDQKIDLMERMNAGIQKLPDEVMSPHERMAIDHDIARAISDERANNDPSRTFMP